MAIRSPIISVLGHVDHGKSSILDSLRGSNIVKGEAGAITQAIGASIIPDHIIKKRCGDLLKQMNISVNIPGLLFIDTPGHAAFTSLRKRGGNIADIAVVVIDINEGFMPQTIEAIEVLKSMKTPFIIAANKIDLIPRFRVGQKNFLATFKDQNEDVRQVIENKIYELVGSLHEKFGLNSERFDRVGDFTSQIGIIPCSAKAGIGMEELLVIITGLAQKYLEKNLALNVEGPAKGIILEVKEDRGLGKTIDVILYDGSLKVGDNIVIGTLDEHITARIRSLLIPEALKDMRDKKSKFKTIKEINAATGIKISSPDFNDSIIAGMPIVGIKDNNEREIIASIKEQINEVTFDMDKKGILVKADTIGSLEALVKMLREKNISLRKADIGNITKKDISDAESNYESDPMSAVILGFNIKNEESTKKVKIIVKDVIYACIDELEDWLKKEEEKLQAKELDGLTKPAKLETLPNCTFRMSNPCIMGIEIIEGTIKSGSKIMDSHGNKIAEIRTMQADKENLNTATRGRQIAASMPGVTAERQIHENEIYYSDLNEKEFRDLKRLKKYLSKPELELLKEIAEIKRKQNPMWGV